MSIVTKEFVGAITETITVTVDSLRRFFTTEIHVIALDAVDGSPVLPTTGTFTVYMQLVKDGNFLAVNDLNGVITGPQSGGSAAADGGGAYILTQSVPQAIKIVPESLDVATHYRVTIKQVEVT